MDKIKYEFSDGTVAFQDELTGKQDIEILRLAGKIKLDEESFKNMSLINLMELLVSNNILPEFFSAILVDDAGGRIEGIESRVLNWKNSEYERILTDFFSLNPTAMKLLNGFVPILGSMNLTQTSAHTETKSESGVTTGDAQEKLS